ncbi:MAG: hypothetical protein ABSG41_19345 [Bryobacteraceae bacterium]
MIAARRTKPGAFGAQAPDTAESATINVNKVTLNIAVENPDIPTEEQFCGTSSLP